MKLKIIIILFLNTIFIISGYSKSTEGYLLFNHQRAFRDVERIVGFGPRYPGSPGSQKAKEYIRTELISAGLSIKEQSFTAVTPIGNIKMTNIIGIFPGKSSRIIIIASHYDTKYFKEFNFVGANDGGSSTGVLLEIARAIRYIPLNYTYWLVFFDGEEAFRRWSEDDGLYGSRYMIKNLLSTNKIKDISAMILLDMIGDKNLNIKREINSTSWIVDTIWGKAKENGFSQYFMDETIRVEDDHFPFLNAGIPAAVVIDMEYGEFERNYWHTREDTLDKIDKRSLEIVGKTIIMSLPDIEYHLRRK